jgi:cell division protein FtsB
MLKPVGRSKKNLCPYFSIVIFPLERDDLLIKSTDVSNFKSNDDLQRQLDKQKAENEQQKMELEKLREALSERDAIIEQQDKRLLVDHETQAIQTVSIFVVI